MILSDDTIYRFFSERHDWQTCSEYGEPGYGNANTTLVVLGSYWCRCGNSPHAGSSDYWGKVVEPTALHDFAAHHPRFFAQLESQGVEFEWYDEWTIDYDADKAYRTQGDSYDWQPSAIYDDGGELMTPDTDIETWIEWLTEEPDRRCLPSRIHHASALEAVGFVKHNGQFENGWHPGQDDDPKVIVERIREDFPDDQIVFVLDYNSQFYSGFSAYHRSPDWEADTSPATENVSSTTGGD